MGELYNQDLITLDQITVCVDKLLDNAQEHSLVALCALLNTVGLKFESSCKDKSHMDKLFEKLEQLATCSKARVRCLIKDVVEKRANEWRHRKLDLINQPKTLQEIRDEILLELEEFENSSNGSNSPLCRPIRRNRRRNRNGRHS